MRTTELVFAALALVAGGCAQRGDATASGAVPSASASAAPPVAPVALAPAAPGRAWGCGERDQPACPMQRWMKSTMARASAHGDPTELAQALDYVARRPPKDAPGWSLIASRGAESARAGDVEGAKQSCKECHDRLKPGFLATQRDAPF